MTSPRTGTAADISQLYIDGDFRPALDGTTFDVEDPATETCIGVVANAGPDDGIAALAAASRAARPWADTAPRKRSELLYRAFDLLVERADSIARTVVAECGKPLAESRGEVLYAAEFLRWFAEEAVRAGGGAVRAPSGDHNTLVVRRPVGVSLLVTPWNFPAAMITRKVAPALAAGCPVIVKPAPETPLTALAIADIFHDIGTPPGVVNVLPSDRAAALVTPMFGDPRLRKLSFTGSTDVGRQLLTLAAQQVMNVSLELGGNAPFVVLADADLDTAVADAVFGKTRVAGQACTAPNRFLVDDRVHDAFVERLSEAFANLNVGHGLSDGVDLGPVISVEAQKRLTSLVDDAVSRGARLVVGGHPRDGRGHFFEPTVLTDVPDDAVLLHEEVFGPIAPIRRFTDVDAAIDECNATEHGLSAYLYGDLKTTMRIADRIDVGLVGIGRLFGYDPSAPFGGVKQSGLGHEGGHEGLEAFLERQTRKVAW
jgi:succinate-semialdehyde dehydrogenase / glutarate-semialdehyde dehydrogenase